MNNTKGLKWLKIQLTLLECIFKENWKTYQSSKLIHVTSVSIFNFLEEEWKKIPIFQPIS